MHQPSIHKKELYFLTAQTVLLLTAGLTLLVTHTGYIMGSILLGVGCLYFKKLIYQITYTEQQILQFLDAVENKEHSLCIPNNSSQYTEEFKCSLERINQTLQKAQEEIYTQETFFHSLLQLIPEGFLVWNSNDNIVFQNQEARKLLNFDQLSFINQLYHPYPELKGLILQNNETGTALLRNKDKSLFLTKKQIIVKKETYNILTVKDITQTLSEQEVEAWNKLTRVLTHEVMNAIAPIISLSNTLQQQSSTDSRTLKGLRVIKEQSERLLQFTQSYRQLSYLPYPDKKIVSLCTLLDNIKILLQPELTAQDVSLEFNFPDKEVLIQVDAEQIQQVFLNLLHNSLQAFSADTKDKRISVSIISETEANQILIFIEDNGNGIPKAIQEKIFIPFYTTKEQGSGIGLALSRQIIQRHGGTLDLKESNSRCTCFRISIPKN